jgi:hypothetical protein
MAFWEEAQIGIFDGRSVDILDMGGFLWDKSW